MQRNSIRWLSCILILVLAAHASCYADMSVSASHSIVSSKVNEKGLNTVTLQLRLHNTGTVSLFNLVLIPEPSKVIANKKEMSDIVIASLSAGTDLNVNWKIKTKLSSKLVLKQFFVFTAKAVNSLQQAVSFSLVSVAKSN